MKRSSKITAALAVALLTSIFISSAAFAAAPNVSCQPLYSRVNEKGISEDFAVGPNLIVGTTLSSMTFRGFKIEAQLVQQCGSEGNSCRDDYHFSPRISRGEQSSHMNTPLLVGPFGWNRWSLALDQGRESLMINCDFETR